MSKTLKQVLCGELKGLEDYYINQSLSATSPQFDLEKKVTLDSDTGDEIHIRTFATVTQWINFVESNNPRTKFSDISQEKKGCCADAFLESQNDTLTRELDEEIEASKVHVAYKRYFNGLNKPLIELTDGSNIEYLLPQNEQHAHTLYLLGYRATDVPMFNVATQEPLVPFIRKEDVETFRLTHLTHMEVIENYIIAEGLDVPLSAGNTLNRAGFFELIEDFVNYNKK